MATKQVQKIENLKKCIEKKVELEEALHEKKEELEILKYESKRNPDTKDQIHEIKFDIKDLESNLSHTNKQVKSFASQLGGSKSLKMSWVFLLSFIMLAIGAAIGYYLIPMVSILPGQPPVALVNQITLCERIFNGAPHKAAGTFEIAQEKKVTAFTKISSRTKRTDYFIDWLYKNRVRETSPLRVQPTGGPAWGEKIFTKNDLGEWKVILRTGDGNVLYETSLTLIYPTIEVTQGVICEGVSDNQPKNPATLFLARDRSLACFTEIETNERYTEISHVWYLNNKQRLKRSFALEKEHTRKTSHLEIKARDAGSWHVDVLSGNGKLLKRINFALQNQEISVPELGFYARLIDEKPDSLLQSFVTDGQPVYCSSELESNFPDYKIKHIWFFNNKQAYVEEAQINSTRARIHSSHTISAKQAGRWEVRVVDEKGKTLHRASINGHKPITEDVKITQLVVCRTIFDMDPEDIAGQFRLGDETRIYAHATVRNRLNRHTSITIKWYHHDKFTGTSTTVGKIIRATGYRTYTYKTISPAQKGAWKVKVFAEDGSFLKETSFVIQ